MGRVVPIPVSPGAGAKRYLGPSNRNTTAQWRSVIFMQTLAVIERVLYSLLGALGRKSLTRVMVPNVCSHENSLFLVESRARVPDLPDVTVDPGDATVDLMVELPKPPFGLKSELARRHVLRRGYSRPNLRTEVGINVTKHR